MAYFSGRCQTFPRFHGKSEVMEQGLQVETCFLIASLGMNVGSSAWPKSWAAHHGATGGQHELIQVVEFLSEDA